MSRKVLGRGAHDSRSDLASALLAYVDYWNAQAHPFVWPMARNSSMILQSLHNHRLVTSDGRY